MKKIIENKIVAFSVVALLLLPVATTTALASNDYDFGYSIRIYGSDPIDVSSGNRNTVNCNNAWMVRLDYSGEGVGTSTSFWLERLNGTPVSLVYNIQQGHPPYYFPTYGYCDYGMVKLVAENNNYASTIQYDISGIWDPQTDIYLS